MREREKSKKFYFCHLSSDAICWGHFDLHIFYKELYEKDTYPLGKGMPRLLSYMYFIFSVELSIYFCQKFHETSKIILHRILRKI